MQTSEVNNNQVVKMQPAKINWRQFGKHWIVVFILAIIAGLIIWGMLHLGPWLKDWQDRRIAQVLKNQLEQEYLADKYGGTTPEETLNLFIVALEKDNTDLASRFFVLEKQIQWKKTLDEYKSKALLSNFLQELKSSKQAGDIIFKKYPSGLWKLDDL